MRRSVTCCAASIFLFLSICLATAHVVQVSTSKYGIHAPRCCRAGLTSWSRWIQRRPFCSQERHENGAFTARNPRTLLTGRWKHVRKAFMTAPALLHLSRRIYRKLLEFSSIRVLIFGNADVSRMAGNDTSSNLFCRQAKQSFTLETKIRDTGDFFAKNTSSFGELVSN